MASPLRRYVSCAFDSSLHLGWCALRSDSPRDWWIRAGPQLARKLCTVLERRSAVEWGGVPDHPAGHPAQPSKWSDRPSEPRQNLGFASLTLHGREVSMRVQRVKPTERAPVWVVSAPSVERIEALYDAHGPTWLERWLPDWARYDREEDPMLLVTKSDEASVELRMTCSAANPTDACAWTKRQRSAPLHGRPPSSCGSNHRYAFVTVRHFSGPSGMSATQASLPTRSSCVRLGALLFVATIGLVVAREPIEEVLIARFGPPPAQMQERYQRGTGGTDVDHAGWDALVSAHVEPGGWVDYAGFRAHAEALDAYLQRVAKAPFDALGRDAKLALLINAYNAFTVRLILDHYPVESIRDIPESKRWKGRTWTVGGHRWTLDEIEHVQIRDHFREPRIHFALVCAAIGCPPLRDEAYTPEKLDAQLEAQAAYVHRHPRWYRFDTSENTAHLTRLYRWYRSDFQKTAGSVLQFAAGYAPSLRTALEAGKKPSVAWLPYDWTLNDVEHRK